jgi:hypothetical protein
MTASKRLHGNDVETDAAGLCVIRSKFPDGSAGH